MNNYINKFELWTRCNFINVKKKIDLSHYDDNIINNIILAKDKIIFKTKNKISYKFVNLIQEKL